MITDNIKLSPVDLDLLEAFNWKLNNKGYLVTVNRIEGQQVYLHRLIANRMSLPSKLEVDHIDSNPYNNTRENLRSATRKQQCANRSMSSHNTSGYKGVFFDKRRKANPWKAGLTLDRKYISLGTFPTAEEAARAYDKAAVEAWGEYAKTNSMLGLVK